jgi:uncharacterized protein
MDGLLNLIYLFALLILIFVLANLAEARRLQEQPYQALSITALLALALLHCVFIFLSTIPYLLEAARHNPELLATINKSMAAMDNPPITKALLDQINSLPRVGFSLWFPALIGIVLLLPPIRQLFARLLPIDAASPVHAAALSLSVIVLTQLMVTLNIGLNNIAEFTAIQATAGATPDTMAVLWTQQIMTAVFAFFGVGWLVRRDWGATLCRLGVVVPSWRNVTLGVVVGFGMVPVVILIEQLTAQYNIGIDPSVQKLTEQLLGPLSTTFFGIITLGVSAALGEETIFRGALQPRFGIVLTALLFALVHSNYGISISTLVVFLFGLLFGVIRLRTNTSTSMISHALYNMSLGLLTYLGI